MSAGDASTLRQVSLAALLGLDARLLLTTDDPATHVVYDRLIDQSYEWWMRRAEVWRENQAALVVEYLGVALGRKR